jgi:hypothetical protein
MLPGLLVKLGPINLFGFYLFIVLEPGAVQFTG